MISFKRLLLFLSILGLTLSISQTGFSQKEEAYEQISELKSGFLLVRLFTKFKGIEALRKAGNDSYADKIESKTKAYNSEIIKGFSSEFNFCDVYFFYSENSSQVIDRNFINAGVFDVEGEYIPLHLLENRPYYLAEISNIEQRNTHSNSHDIYLSRSDSAGVEKRYRHENSKSFGFEALLIKDNNFNQLSTPFPYYQRTFAGVFFLKKKPKLVVKNWNARLSEFYRKALMN